MGVDYRAVLLIGKEFYSSSEIIEYLSEKNLLTEEDHTYLEENGNYGVSELDIRGMQAECLDCYSGDYWGLGFSPSVRDIENFANNIKEAQAKWLELTGEEADIIHTVKVY